MEVIVPHMEFTHFSLAETPSVSFNMLARATIIFCNASKPAHPNLLSVKWSCIPVVEFGLPFRPLSARLLPLWVAHLGTQKSAIGFYKRMYATNHLSALQALIWRINHV